MAGRSRHQELVAEIEELGRRLADLRRRVGADLEADEPPSGAMDLLLCRVGDERVALRLEAVEEVVPMARLAALPEAPKWIPGVLNLGGHSLPVIDTLARLTRRERRPELSDLIVICRSDGRQVGLIVEEIFDVHRAQPGSLQEVGDDGQLAPYLRGIINADGDPILLISIRRLMSSSDLPEVER